MEIHDVNRENRSIFNNRPLLKGIIFYIAGILFSTALEIHYYYSLIFLVAVAVSALSLYLKETYRAAGITLLIFLFALGWFRADLSQEPFPPNHIENLARQGGRAVLFGRIVDEPDIREDRTYLVIETDSVAVRSFTIPSFGRVRVRILNGGSRYDHSDYVAAEGILYVPDNARNPGGFDYAKYLRGKNI